MKLIEFGEIYKQLVACYSGRLPDNKDTMKVWFGLLKDLPGDLVQAAALEFMGSPSAFPPTPGQIRGKATDLQIRASGLPSASEAWKEVLEAPVSGFTQRSIENPENPERPWIIERKTYKWSHPLVEKVAKAMGWPKRLFTDNAASDRARFIDAYDAAIDRETVEAGGLPQVREYIQRIGSGTDMPQLLQQFRSEAFDRGEGELQ